MIRLSESYDWIVLGDHPGALLSAGMAAKLGLSVLILPLGPSLRRQASRDGQIIDPEANFFLGLDAAREEGARAGLFAECLTRIGMQPEEAGLVRPGQGLPQIATPSLRFGLEGDVEAISSELAREIGADAARELGMAEAVAVAREPVLAFWQELPARLTLSPEPAKKREARPPADVAEVFQKTVRALGRGQPRGVLRWLEDAELDLPQPLQEAGLGAFYGMTGSVAGPPLARELIHALALASVSGAFVGGATALREWLVRVAQRAGAHAPTDADCRRIFVESGRFRGVQIANRGRMISATGAVLGCSVEHARERLSESGKSSSGGMAAPEPRGWRFTLSLTVHAEAIPPGMSRRLVWQESGAPALEIEQADPAELGSRMPDKKLLFVRTVLPFSKESLEPEYQRMIAARMFRQASQLLPFLEFHVVQAFPDFRDETWRGKEVFGFTSLAEIPESLRVQGREGLGSQTGIEGLFTATGESHPELGSLGPTVAAVEAVAWLAHRIGQPGPFA